MTAPLLFATIAALLTWKRLFPRVAMVSAMLAAGTLPGWPHDILVAISEWLVNMTNWAFNTVAKEPKGSHFASGLLAFIAGFIFVCELIKKGTSTGSSKRNPTMWSAILLPFLLPYFAGPIGGGASQAIDMLTTQMVAVVGGMLT